MNDHLFNFPNKEERNDFYIALIVIAFFGWLFFHFIYYENKMIPESTASLDPITSAIVVLDEDRDGIPDDEDKCPQLAGIAANSGCPADEDGDGIYDKFDLCPTKKGSESNSGCPEDKDTDGDGFPDKDDKCPELVGDDYGCPPDADGDGIPNAKDKCPRNAGSADNNGCPPDTDADGVFDEEDACPELAGLKENNGCPADADGDGVYDEDDKCPNLVGTKADAGCPADRDKDGIYDKDDKCPQVAGIAANNGCPEMKDADGDGVEDAVDKCPNKPGDKANNGCPEIKIDKADKAVIEKAVKSVAFLPASPNLTVYSQNLLKKVADLLKKYPDYKLLISGHTDSIGTEAGNLKLSKARAKTCADFLTKRGISPSRLSHDGYGESQPVADNNTSAGRLKNRRVEFKLQY